MRLLCIAIALVAALFYGCDSSRVYEDYQDFNARTWSKDSIKSFSFRIEDPGVTYNVLYNVRNTLSFPYHNLYVTYYLKDSTGSTISSELQEMILFDPKTGSPNGSGLGDLFDSQHPSLTNYKFPFKGTFTFSIEQFMRREQLPEMVSIGVRVEKSGD